ncbi:MAG TPA: DHA2 family efflux MFS transporter permease subunit [Solirubrobacteraceae bacterium]|nr:DHA2 family efflux MFS transporter permease subunit [Solirubrobacteraceae bacterium]
MTLTAAQKRITLLAAIMGSFVALLDSTVVNVALPSIRDDLGGGLAGQQWIVNAYLLLLGSLILIGGSLGDVYGERRVFVVGVAGFGGASVLCAAAPSLELLVAGRALQGAFGALLTPASLAIIVGAFSGDERGAAIGSWTAYSGIAALVGPLVGGWLVDALSWRWIFAINVPFVAITLLLTARMPAMSRGATGRRPDWVGAALCAAGLAGPTFGLIQQPEHGWGSGMVVVPIVAGLAVFAAFLAWERRERDPMLPLGLFARGNFAWGNVETLAMYGGLGVLVFLLVLFLQQVGGYDAFEAGLVLLPTTLAMFFLSRRFGALADRRGPRLLMGIGPLVCAAGALLLIALVDTDPRFAADVLPGVVVFALGLSITVAPLTAAILADADEQNAGIASGVNNAVARVASLLAVAGIGAVIGGTLDLDGFRMGMAFAAGLLALGGLIGLARIRDPRRRVAAEECPGGQLAGQPKPAWCPEEDVAAPAPGEPAPAPAR